jgi:hypothetical protein
MKNLIIVIPPSEPTNTTVKNETNNDSNSGNRILKNLFSFPIKKSYLLINLIIFFPDRNQK